MTFRERAVASAMGLGFVTAAVGGTYLLADKETIIPLAVAACVATVSSVLLRYALVSMQVAIHRPRVRHFRHHRHYSGERAEYVRTSQRLAMMDRDFTAADYEMLLDLDNNSQRFRRFLEGASQETVDQLPTYVYKKPDPPSRPASQQAPLSSRCAAVGKRCVDGEDNDEVGHNKDGEGEDRGSASVDDVVTVSDDGVGEEEEEGVCEASLLSGDETATKCMICLEDFEDGMELRLLPCFHRFMVECIDPWLAQQAKCPVCKRSIQDDMNALPAGLG